MKPRILEVRTKILKKNDEIARAMRARFGVSGVYVVNVVSSPGAGKTGLLTRVMTELSRDMTVVAVVGDLATEHDAARLAESGCEARQISTGTLCHLEADMVEKAIEGWSLDGIDVLFIENVGNLVCPQGFDLGEDLRLLLFPVTEGEDKPLKYPTLINTCDAVAISKMDLAVAVGFDLETAKANTEKARPGVAVFETSARTGAGVDELAAFLRERVAAKRAEPVDAVAP
ncbi:MAG: hydrogenase nickel incorporation protein HypB [Phycisphaeraceae bacterium]|nr:MAG: hydrogenase nickel incorporation protein HypB [Phycisphaeraceae bacterium]